MAETNSKKRRRRLAAGWATGIVLGASVLGAALGTTYALAWDHPSVINQKAWTVSVSANKTTIVAGQSATFSAKLAKTNAKNVTYSWVVQTGTNKTLPAKTSTNTWTWTAPTDITVNTSYTVFVSATIKNVTHTSSIKITVEPVISSVTIPSTVNGELGTDLNITPTIKTNINSTDSTYSWLINGNQVATTENLSYLLSNSSTVRTLSVQLVVTANNARFTSNTCLVTIGNQNTYPISISNQTVYSNNTFTLIPKLNLKTLPANSTYKWIVNGQSTESSTFGPTTFTAPATAQKQQTSAYLEVIKNGVVVDESNVAVITVEPATMSFTNATKTATAASNYDFKLSTAGFPSTGALTYKWVITGNNDTEILKTTTDAPQYTWNIPVTVTGNLTVSVSVVLPDNITVSTTEQLTVSPTTQKLSILGLPTQTVYVQSFVGFSLTANGNGNIESPTYTWTVSANGKNVTNDFDVQNNKISFNSMNYNSPLGTYTFTVTLSAPGQQSVSQTVTVVNEPMNTITQAHKTISIFANQKVKLNPTNSVDIPNSNISYSWAWDVGNVSTPIANQTGLTFDGTLPNITDTLKQAVTGQLVLTTKYTLNTELNTTNVTWRDGEVETIWTVTVNPVPTTPSLSFAHNDYTAYAGLPFTITANELNLPADTQYAWTLTDNNTQTNLSATGLTYSTTFDYTSKTVISLTITTLWRNPETNQMQMISAVAAVTVYPKPSANLSTLNIGYFTNQPLTLAPFANTELPASAYVKWLFNGEPWSMDTNLNNMQWPSNYNTTTYNNTITCDVYLGTTLWSSSTKTVYVLPVLNYTLPTCPFSNGEWMVPAGGTFEYGPNQFSVNPNLSSAFNYNVTFDMTSSNSAFTITPNTNKIQSTLAHQVTTIGITYNITATIPDDATHKLIKISTAMHPKSITVASFPYQPKITPSAGWTFANNTFTGYAGDGFNATMTAGEWPFLNTSLTVPQPKLILTYENGTAQTNYFLPNKTNISLTSSDINDYSIGSSLVYKLSTQTFTCNILYGANYKFDLLATPKLTGAFNSTNNHYFTNQIPATAFDYSVTNANANAVYKATIKDNNGTVTNVPLNNANQITTLANLPAGSYTLTMTVNDTIDGTAESISFSKTFTIVQALSDQTVSYSQNYALLQPITNYAPSAITKNFQPITGETFAYAWYTQQAGSSNWVKTSCTADTLSLPGQTSAGTYNVKLVVTQKIDSLTNTATYTGMSYTIQQPILKIGFPKTAYSAGQSVSKAIYSVTNVYYNHVSVGSGSLVSASGKVLLNNISFNVPTAVLPGASGVASSEPYTMFATSINSFTIPNVSKITTATISVPVTLELNTGAKVTVALKATETITLYPTLTIAHKWPSTIYMYNLPDQSITYTPETSYTGSVLKYSWHLMPPPTNTNSAGQEAPNGITAQTLAMKLSNTTGSSVTISYNPNGTQNQALFYLIITNTATNASVTENATLVVISPASINLSTPNANYVVSQNVTINESQSLGSQTVSNPAWTYGIGHGEPTTSLTMPAGVLNNGSMSYTVPATAFANKQLTKAETVNVELTNTVSVNTGTPFAESTSVNGNCLFNIEPEKATLATMSFSSVPELVTNATAYNQFYNGGASSYGSNESVSVKLNWINSAFANTQVTYKWYLVSATNSNPVTGVLATVQDNQNGTNTPDTLQTSTSTLAGLSVNEKWQVQYQTNWQALAPIAYNFVCEATYINPLTHQTETIKTIAPTQTTFLNLFEFNFQDIDVVSGFVNQQIPIAYWTLPKTWPSEFSVSYPTPTVSSNLTLINKGVVDGAPQVFISSVTPLTDGTAWVNVGQGQLSYKGHPIFQLQAINEISKVSVYIYPVLSLQTENFSLFANKSTEDYDLKFNLSPGDKQANIPSELRQLYWGSNGQNQTNILYVRLAALNSQYLKLGSSAHETIFSGSDNTGLIWPTALRNPTNLYGKFVLQDLPTNVTKPTIWAGSGKKITLTMEYIAGYRHFLHIGLFAVWFPETFTLTLPTITIYPQPTFSVHGNNVTSTTNNTFNLDAGSASFAITNYPNAMSDQDLTITTTLSGPNSASPTVTWTGFNSNSVDLTPGTWTATVTFTNTNGEQTQTWTETYTLNVTNPAPLSTSILLEDDGQSIGLNEFAGFNHFFIAGWDSQWFSQATAAYTGGLITYMQFKNLADYETDPLTYSFSIIQNHVTIDDLMTNVPLISNLNKNQDLPMTFSFTPKDVGNYVLMFNVFDNKTELANYSIPFYVAPNPNTNVSSTYNFSNVSNMPGNISYTKSTVTVPEDKTIYLRSNDSWSSSVPSGPGSSSALNGPGSPYGNNGAMPVNGAPKPDVPAGTPIIIWQEKINDTWKTIATNTLSFNLASLTNNTILRTGMMYTPYAVSTLNGQSYSYIYSYPLTVTPVKSSFSFSSGYQARENEYWNVGIFGPSTLIQGADISAIMTFNNHTEQLQSAPVEGSNGSVLQYVYSFMTPNVSGKVTLTISLQEPYMSTPFIFTQTATQSMQSNN